ncbi:MAG: tryptophan synthase subunit beta [Bacteroidales bacterium]|nr:tryptophan synthase subunit beta [Bacteroidales bacterium]
MNTTTQLSAITSTKDGYFGQFGGSFVPDVLKLSFDKLYNQFLEAIKDPSFDQEFMSYLNDYVGRPSPLYYAKRLSEHIGSKIYLKREDLNHTGAHKINNTLGQILLAKRMGYKEVIAETGAGQHGVATATAAALFGMKCKVFMGKTDYDRQLLNVNRIKLLGAEVYPISEGGAGLKDAVDAAIGYFIEHPEVFYILGSAVGPHPYPTIVRYFQSVIGKEAREQILAKENRLPDSIIACIGGGSNAIGIFSAFLDDKDVKIFAAEGGGEGLILGKTAATLSLGKPMAFQGSYSLVLQDEQGNPVKSHSVAAGLDYPGIGPEHSHLNEIKRVKYMPINDSEAINAFKLLSKIEGIIPAMESSHAIALASKILKNKNELTIINLSGRGDKDVDRVLAD